MSSLTYGVSPQPAQAPEYSNSGRSSWLPLTVLTRTWVRSGSGRPRKKRVVLPFRLAERRLERHVDGLAARGRPCLCPGRSPRRRRSRCSPRAPPGRSTSGRRISLPLASHRLEGGRGAGEQGRVVDLGADGGVRAVERALAALDADVRIPHRDLEGDVALLPLGGVGRPDAVVGHRADTGSWSPQPAMIGAVTFLTNSGASVGHQRGLVPRAASTTLGHLDLVQVGDGLVHGVVVHAGRPSRRACRRSS